MLINERHIDTDRAGDAQGGGNYATLTDFLNRRRVSVAPFSEADLVVSAAQFVLLDATNFPGTIALGAASEETTGGYVAAALGGAVGTAGLTAINDALGNVTNLVEVRDAATHDSVLSAGGRKVYGLLQAASTVTDGEAVGAAASENLQCSFVEIGEDGTLTLVAIDGTFEVALPKMYAERHMPSYFKEGSTAEADVIAPSTVPSEPVCRKYIVTAAFAANEIITVSTGAGAGSGASTASGDTIASLGLSAGDFSNDNRTRVRVNGYQQTKGTDAVWDSSTTFHFAVPLDPGDTFEVEVAQ